MPRNKDFQVGDVVRIRDYEDMKSEFGTIGISNDIDCASRFIEQMKYLCGFTFYISNLFDNIVEGHRTTWTISTDMIELVRRDGEIVQSEELSEYLSQISVIEG